MKLKIKDIREEFDLNQEDINCIIDIYLVAYYNKQKNISIES
ncbi:MAG: hypothetical protein PHE54_02465 [Bacilli bacterium]|nr:hypothetical protein [Bacilli bacterium]